MSRRFAAPRRGVEFPSRARASGSDHLPWALPRILQVIPKIKRVGGSRWHAGRGRGIVCSKGVNSAFTLGKHASAIAARTAEMRLGDGRGGRHSNDIVRRPRGSRTGKGKVGATENVSKTGNYQSQRQLATPRG